MHVIKVMAEGGDPLVYFVQETKDCLLERGVSTFWDAFRKQYEHASFAVTMTIMKDSGYYYSPKLGQYILTDRYEDVVIPLNDAAKEKLRESPLEKNER